MRNAILAFAMLMAPATILAQNCQTAKAPASCSFQLATPATLTNPRTLRLTMSSTTTTATTALTDFDNTFIPITGPTATINANRPWTLLISSTAATWTNVGTGSRANKPASDLKWSTSVAGTFTSLSTTTTQITTGAATNSTVTSLFFRGTLSWTLDTPGVYTLGVTMTLTTP